jgi:multidrug efflux pump subunit AcrB
MATHPPELILFRWQAALITTAILLTVVMTSGGMALLGIPLHRISVAALMIALGMLVDPAQRPSYQ